MYITLQLLYLYQSLAMLLLMLRSVSFDIILSVCVFYIWRMTVLFIHLLLRLVRLLSISIYVPVRAGMSPQRHSEALSAEKLLYY